ncbi:hypothetical protein Tco_1504453, partial [Tanacetum coccineum]
IKFHANCYDSNDMYDIQVGKARLAKDVLPSFFGSKPYIIQRLGYQQLEVCSGGRFDKSFIGRSSKVFRDQCSSCMLNRNTGSGGAKLLVPNSKSGATSAKESSTPEMLWHQWHWFDTRILVP